MQASCVVLHAGPAGCQQQLSVQEIASYDSHIKFWRPEPPGKTLAVVQMVLQPTVSLRSQRFSSSKHMKIKLPGSCQVHLADEAYSVTLPKVLIRNLSEPSADTELAGELLSIAAVSYESAGGHCWLMSIASSHLVLNAIHS